MLGEQRQGTGGGDLRKKAGGKSKQGGECWRH